MDKQKIIKAAQLPLVANPPALVQQVAEGRPSLQQYLAGRRQAPAASPPVAGAVPQARNLPAGLSYIDPNARRVGMGIVPKASPSATRQAMQQRIQEMYAPYYQKAQAAHRAGLKVPAKFRASKGRMVPLEEVARRKMAYTEMPQMPWGYGQGAARRLRPEAVTAEGYKLMSPEEASAQLEKEMAGSARRKQFMSQHARPQTGPRLQQAQKAGRDAMVYHRRGPALRQALSRGIKGQTLPPSGFVSPSKGMPSRALSTVRGRMGKGPSLMKGLGRIFKGLRGKF